MKKLILPFLLFSFFSINSSCQTQSSVEDTYTYITPSRDGTGKVYQGREISQVMGFAGKEWLERAEREREEGIAAALKNLPINSSSVVADIGAGSGYYTFRISPLIPEGKIYAVDIQEDAVSYIKKRSEVLGVKNVVSIKGTEKSPNLPEGEIDLVIMVDVYHELAYPREMLTAIYKSLKPDGKILLLEYKGEDPSIAIKPLHKMTEKQAVKELKINGFDLVQNGTYLPIQHYMVFQKAK
ncbi:methyltransferase family protein [Algoriphagus ratkowskyi]|uniref:Class I SAM-dependent methyltransferase n=1 Tax=Algoriphagus ratkowskyi TaxID=57028 RepID=A0A2W7S0W5_9BACT|nr:class I SAM-dependent methyltransferase [Algoriphagus ratkowskyi]PZX60479.1 methyltransferase family protein [Algoriphagus ratkowskyi]TXD78283.1 class I SAM-dependent methyltransferase [Algoriphagus ratkowskyi]